MSILHLNYSAGWGGLEIVSRDLFLGLAAAGHDVRALVRTGSPLHRALLASAHAKRVEHDDPRKYVDRAAARRLCARIARHDVRVIQTFKSADIALVTLPLGKLGANRPAVVHHLQMLPGHARRDPFHRFAYRRLDRVVAITDQMAQRIPDLWPIDAGRVRTIRHGLDLEAFARDRERAAAARRRFGLPADAPLVGLVGRIYEDKGQRFLFDVFERLADDFPGVHLVLAGEPEGEGKDAARARRYHAELLDAIRGSAVRDRVHATGFCDDVPGMMQALDVFVFASRPEAFGLVVVEAMAAGCVTLGPRAGGVPEIVDDGETGWTYAVRDAGDLERVLRRALTMDSTERAAMQDAAAVSVRERYGRDRMLREFAALYEELGERRAVAG